MSSWATGVAVVTSRDASGPRGATSNALTSLSLDPLLVLVALEHASNTLAAVRNSGRFCINVLAADQEEIARRFATKASGEEKLAGVPHELVDGVPVLGGALAWLACELERELDGGDHDPTRAAHSRPAPIRPDSRLSSTAAASTPARSSASADGSRKPAPRSRRSTR